ncbi:nitrite reductase large subunit NirB [Alkalihalobacillus hemicellulosilyticus]|uniref:Nitrite reductase n=1 Tax=Halalkalibacter hemicellulosilyticusJCM 9152 TaxID=1236971 RepID=W4Q9Z6_9BACI|nr:nitrite reductase large subunit NirB [Halalkalibacter hemicellulosilyticus]GAE28876.1 nitrite reductase [Halalkalibacter hemicellulosilyticusJCM 9152]
MKTQKLVIIGNGMAGVRCAEEILKYAASAFDITIIGSEPHGNYNRIMLSSVLQGGTNMKDIMINDIDWYKENGITLYVGETVKRLNRQGKTVETDSGRKVLYDKVVIATGSSPFMIPLPGIDLEGVMAFRTVEDCEKMVSSAKSYKKATVIGGGLLGLEAAKGLLHLGMEVDVVHLGPYLMERQLDEKAAKLLQEELEHQGMNFLLEKQSERLLGRKRVKGIEFKDGSSVRTDLVVMAVGVRPNITLAKESGLEMNRAIIVNDYMQTSDPDIYAVGECVEHRGFVYGLVKPLYEQGVVLAKHLCEQPTRGYQGTILSTQLKISGVDVFSVGQFHDSDDTESIMMLDETESIYKKVVFQDDCAVGAVLYGDTKEGTQLMEMIAKGEKREMVKEILMNAHPQTEDHLAEMPMSQTICNCNNVSKGTIIEAVQKHDCSTVDEIKACTKASGSCGGCKPMVAEMLSYIQSDQFNETIVEEPFCACTSLTENEVVDHIVHERLTTIDEVRNKLNWVRDGCEGCIKALRYYLRMIYQRTELTGDLDELVGVQKQDDGRFTLTLPIKGVLLTGEYLQELTLIMKEYNQPHLAVTENQQLTLIDVEETDVLSVMDRLNIERKYASDFWIHHVRTSIVKQNLKQLYVNDMYQLAEALDSVIDHRFAPQHVYITVANDFDKNSTVEKGLTLVRMSRGWEMYIHDTLISIVNREDVNSYVIALIQYYRETASYLEELNSWLNRIGLIHIRELIYEDDLRDQLLNDFTQSTENEWDKSNHVMNK